MLGARSLGPDESRASECYNISPPHSSPPQLVSTFKRHAAPLSALHAASIAPHHWRLRRGDAQTIAESRSTCQAKSDSGISLSFAQLTIYCRAITSLTHCRGRVGIEVRRAEAQSDAKRPLRPIRLRDVGPSSGAGAVATLVDAIVQFRQFLFEVFSGFPRAGKDFPTGNVTPFSDVRLTPTCTVSSRQLETLTIAARSSRSTPRAPRGSVAPISRSLRGNRGGPLTNRVSRVGGRAKGGPYRVRRADVRYPFDFSRRLLCSMPPHRFRQPLPLALHPRNTDIKLSVPLR